MAVVVFRHAGGLFNRRFRHFHLDQHLVAVTGAGSVFSNSFTTMVGANWNADQEWIIDQQRRHGHTTPDATIGGSAGANSNWVTVTGSGAVWLNAGPISLGKSQLELISLTVASSGTVFATVDHGRQFGVANTMIHLQSPGNRLSRPASRRRRGQLACNWKFGQRQRRRSLWSPMRS